MSLYIYISIYIHTQEKHRVQKDARDIALRRWSTHHTLMESVNVYSHTHIYKEYTEMWGT